MRQSILAICCLYIYGNIALASDSELTHYEKLSGWRLLFDGESTQGWRNYLSDRVSDGWSVKNGELRATRGAGDLVTVEKYDNFELVLDYKIAMSGNSGVLFHVTEDAKKPWHSGPEVQILDMMHLSPQKAGFLYALYKPERPRWSKRVRAEAGLPTEAGNAARPAGQWNQLYLRISEAQCEIALNGYSYCRFRLGSEDWEERVAASKFAKFPNFGKAKSGHICLQEHGSSVAFRNIKLRPLTSGGEPQQWPIDGKLDLVGTPAFPKLKWQGWEPTDDRGRVRTMRLMELTHPPQGAIATGTQSDQPTQSKAVDNRLFAATQRGRIYCFQNDPQVTESTLFLDISSRVSPWRRHNEEGLLGLAFHPRFQDNGYVYVYYSVLDPSRTSRVSRFQVSDDDPNVADPTSESVVIEIPQPFHNHNGGSMEFGPDGYLYIALGDGGDLNDPYGHGQNLKTPFGSILRIDVDTKTDELGYGIPAENPFVERSDAMPEIFAYGFRNPWRIAFDSLTGELWMGDVGQDLWEEINIVRRGGNYGWSIAEGTHPFGREANGNSKVIPPIWEYDHRVGRSITGGRVYRGQRLAELFGKYIYADYVTGRVWALEFDRKLQQVTKNLEISDGGITVTAFGEDASGEVYYMIAAANGQCIYRFEHKAEKNAKPR